MEGEAVDWKMVAHSVRDDLVRVSAGLRAAMEHPDPARASLHEAARLLREATDAAETIFADVLALVPAGTAPLLEATVGPAASLVAGLFAAPLPGAVEYAVAHVNLTNGPLERALGELGLLAGTYVEAGHRFGVCGTHLGVEPCDARWMRWRRHHVDAMVQWNETVLRLGAAAKEAEEALRTLQSPLRGERVPEGEEILLGVADEVDKALVAMRDLDHDVTSELSEVWAITNHLA